MSSPAEPSTAESSACPSELTAAASDAEPALKEPKEVESMIAGKIADIESAKEEKDDELRRIVRKSKKMLKEVSTIVASKSLTDSDKLKQLELKLLQQIEESKTTEKALCLSRRKSEQAVRERDVAQADAQKATIVKGKLEDLCRELQKQNRSIVENSEKIAREEDEKRQEVQRKFSTTIADIQVKLEEQNEERVKQYKENDALREKLKYFAEQYDVRDKQMEHQLKTKDLETQLADAKFRQQEEMTRQCNLKVDAYKEQCEQLLKTEQDLRAQLKVYSEKYEGFQEMITKSNEVFAQFKTEMDKNAKVVKKLSNENAALKKKASKSDVALIEMADEQTKLKGALEKEKKANETLKVLSRKLQEERDELRKQASSDGKENFAPEDGEVDAA